VERLVKDRWEKTNPRDKYNSGEDFEYDIEFIGVFSRSSEF
jgi:hypothetical protein